MIKMAKVEALQKEGFEVEKKLMSINVKKDGLVFTVNKREGGSGRVTKRIGGYYVSHGTNYHGERFDTQKEAVEYIKEHF